VNWLDVLCLAKCTECIRTATCNSGSDTLMHNGNPSSPRCLPKQPPKHGLNRAPKCKLPCNFVPEVRLFLAHILDVLQQYFRPSTSNFTCLALPCRSELDCFGIEIGFKRYPRPRTCGSQNRISHESQPHTKAPCPCLPERRPDRNRTVQVREHGSDLACAAMLCILRIYYSMRWTLFCVAAQISHS
jgi:hypothetical protein